MRKHRVKRRSRLRRVRKGAIARHFAGKCKCDDPVFASKGFKTICVAEMFYINPPLYEL